VNAAAILARPAMLARVARVMRDRYGYAQPWRRAWIELRNVGRGAA